MYADSGNFANTASCGGRIDLKYSSPNATITAPFYYQPSTTGVDMDCWWYISCPYGEQVHLTLVDVDTVDEQIYVNDHPTDKYSSYRVLSVSGHIDSALNVTSTRGGLVVNLNDNSLDTNGRGMLFVVQIFGNVR